MKKLLAIVPVALIIAGCGSNHVANSTVTQRDVVTETTQAPSDQSCKQLVFVLLKALGNSNNATIAALHMDYSKANSLVDKLNAELDKAKPMVTPCRDS